MVRGQHFAIDLQLNMHKLKRRVCFVIKEVFFIKDYYVNYSHVDTPFIDLFLILEIGRSSCST